MQKPKKFFLIDVMAMAFRTYHAFGHRPLLTSQGLPTSAVFGSAIYLLKLLQEEKPDYLVLVSDSKEKNFRHELYTHYKANRTEMPDDLAVQIPYLFELFNHMGLPLVRQPGFEADDLIGTLVRRFGDTNHHCFIVSGDKDFCQLVNDHTFVFQPKKGGTNLIITSADVKERFHCTPAQVVDILALWGDGVDNVPGVPGVGEKSAIKLIEQFGSIDEILAQVNTVANKRIRDALIAHREQLLLARQLVKIKTDIPIAIELDDMHVDTQKIYASEKLYDFCKTLEFSSLCDRLLKGRQNGVSAVAPTRSSKTSSNIKNELFAESEPASLTLKGNYQLVNTKEALEDLAQTLHGASLVAFDTETTGLSVTSSQPIGVSFAIKSGEAYYVPLLPKQLENVHPHEVIAFLQAIFKNKTLIKIAHNLKFDLQMLSNIGIQVDGALGDTMLAAFVCDATEPSYSLDDLSSKYLNIGKVPIETLIGKKRDIPMSEVPLSMLVPYACRDADCCLQLYHYLVKRLQELNLERLYEEVELPLAPILAEMEQTGIFVDSKILEKLSASLTSSKLALEKEIYDLAGEEFNINSPKQLQGILFDKLDIPTQLGIKRLKKTKNGFSTDVSVLESLADHPLPNKILAYRSVSKLQNTYVDVLPKLVDPQTGRVHTSFHQTGTSTGRLSSSNPNLQNIPIQSEQGREIRRAFRARPGHVIVSADYSQIELRVLAHIANEENLRLAFNADKDIHTLTAAQLLQKDPSEITHRDRSNAKAINYGIVYGMGPNRLAQAIEVPIPEAKKFIENYFAHFPGIKHYIDTAVAFAEANGYTQTVLGRRRKIYGLDGNQGTMAQVAARNMAINAPIQGSAADILKLAMISIHKELARTKLKARMLLQVHDELVFECPEEEWDQLREIVCAGMERTYPLSVPLKVNIAAGKDWLEAH